MKKKFTKQEILKRREYQRQWREKKKKGHGTPEPLSTADMKASQITDVVSAFRTLVNFAPDKQTRDDLGRTFMKIITEQPN
jgi:CBS-domain-containing membrane protein